MQVGVQERTAQATFCGNMLVPRGVLNIDPTAVNPVMRQCLTTLEHLHVTDSTSSQVYSQYLHPPAALSSMT